MFVYYDAVSGDILHTVTLAEGYAPPPGDFIEVLDGTPVDPVTQCVTDGDLVTRETASGAQKSLALEHVTRRRGELRQLFITPLPGQDMVYLEKRAEALAYLADPAPTPALYPMVFSEVGITAPTAYQVAQVWLNMSDMWRLASTIIEAATLKAAQEIEAAVTPYDIDDALYAMESAISVLIPS